MAVFWKNIKGMAEDGSSTVYTYIDFITSSAGSQIAVRRNDVTLGNIALADCGLPQNINKITTNFISAKDADSKTIDFTKELITINPEATFKAKITAEQFATFKKDVTINAAVKANTAAITGECQAGFFNATSDKRAKENFEPLSTKAALKTVIDTPLYSFDYKSGAHSIGVLAQDLIHVDMNHFSFVGNQKASGQNGDYMNVHESKFIYLLWAAIQEQQKEIESLRAQLKQFFKGKTFLTGCRASFPLPII